jgi:hypothetical protein
MKQRSTEEIARNARDGAAIDRALVAAFRRTVLRHRAGGVPMVFWRDGRVVEVSADEVELPTVDPPAEKDEAPGL